LPVKNVSVLPMPTVSFWKRLRPPTPPVTYGTTDDRFGAATTTLPL
jgi:hypothetical protein